MTIYISLNLSLTLSLSLSLFLPLSASLSLSLSLCLSLSLLTLFIYHYYVNTLINIINNNKKFSTNIFCWCCRVRRQISCFSYSIMCPQMSFFLSDSKYLSKHHPVSSFYLSHYYLGSVAYLKVRLLVFQLVGLSWILNSLFIRTRQNRAPHLPPMSPSSVLPSSSSSSISLSEISTKTVSCRVPCSSICLFSN